MYIQKLATATAVAIALQGFSTAQAVEINKVQMGIVVDKGAACPRQATMKLWAHTSGPGPVKFVVQNTSGNQTGHLIAQAVKGSANNYLATYTHTMTIQTDVDTKYKAKVVGANLATNWVPLTATCGPQVRTKTSTTSSAAKPRVKKASDVNKPGKKTTTTSSGSNPPAKKASKTKPATKPTNNSASTQKALNKQCKGAKVKVYRVDAVTKKGGIASARAAWSTTVAAKYGLVWAKYKNAVHRSHACTRTGVVYQCVVSATPCRKT